MTPLVYRTKLENSLNYFATFRSLHWKDAYAHYVPYSLQWHIHKGNWRKLYSLSKCVNKRESPSKENNAITLDARVKSVAHHNVQVLCFDPVDVQRTLRRIDAQKAAGPDMILCHLLRRCTDELTQV